ncbi:MAG: hypothetical protein P8P74_09995, partial [Crocinitomicaceae bacterium]|nr:hypothetical protein [Crocinitomicaceae bacterium]
RFVHQSFFDYFVSYEIIERLESKDYKNPIYYKDWSNTIVNFIYDHINTNLKSNKKVPALMLLRSKERLARLKVLIYKIVYGQKDDLYGGLVALTIVLSSVIYFNVIEIKWYWAILVFIPVLFTMLVLILLISGLFEKVKKTKKVRFIEKAFKISFIKGQLSIPKNLDFALKLESSVNVPHIPFEGLTLKDGNYSISKFYRLRNTNFIKGHFMMKILSETSFVNVKLEKVKFNRLLFSSCSFNEVKFVNCKIITNPSFLITEDYSDTPVLKDAYFCFFECRFDTNSLISFVNFIIDNELDITNSVSANENTLEKMKQIETNLLAKLNSNNEITNDKEE